MAIIVVGLFLLLGGTVSGQPWVALVWVLVAWAALELPVEFMLMRQVRREASASG